MARRKAQIVLDCGISAEQRFFYRKTEFLTISLYDLYNGYGELNDFAKLAVLFKELADKGYKGTGLSRVMGYYDSVDDLLLEVIRPERKTPSPTGAGKEEE